MLPNDFLPLLNVVLTVGLLVGGLFAFRKGQSREATEIQNRVVAALKDEVATLRAKVDDLEQDRITQDRIIATIRYALKQYGLHIVINGDFVSLEDKSGQKKITHIRDRMATQQENEGN